MIAPEPRRVSGRRELAAPQLSIVLPCLNEAETLEGCLAEIAAVVARHGISAEVIVADNGSTDGSVEIALRHGARVVNASERGYGRALQAGIASARAPYILMGDSDLSYDFTSIPAFLEQLEAGYDLVMGNRFRGGIAPGAMPFANRWIGNPVLSFAGRLFFGTQTGDFHCGLRAFSRAAYERMGLRAPGMEFASEMVVKSALKGLRVSEVPTVLRKDGRSRPPHLRPWQDGWRHLRLMLLHSPRWLFLFPGAALMLAGLLVSLWLLPGPRHVGRLWFDIHTLLVAGVMILVGYQVVVFAVFSKVFATERGLSPENPWLTTLFRYVTLETGILAGVTMTALGLLTITVAGWTWGSGGFGALDPQQTMRQMIPAVVLLALGVQTIFASFFLSILGTAGAR